MIVDAVSYLQTALHIVDGDNEKRPPEANEGPLGSIMALESDRALELTSLGLYRRRTTGATLPHSGQPGVCTLGNGRISGDPRDRARTPTL